MKRTTPTLTDQVRQALETCGKTRYKICQETGIDQATLCRFVGGKSGLSNWTLDTLGEYLGLRVVVEKPKKGR